jgi:hypothetical protein
VIGVFVMPEIPDWLPKVLFTCVMTAAVLWTVGMAVRSFWRRGWSEYHRLVSMRSRTPLEELVAGRRRVERNADLVIAETREIVEAAHRQVAGLYDEPARSLPVNRPSFP